MSDIVSLYNKYATRLEPMLGEISKYVKKGDTVIDLGCGTGIYIDAIREQIDKEGRLICIDKNREMVSYCRKRFSKKGIVFKALTAERLSSLKEKADIIFASLVLQFTEIKKSLSELDKCLKSGGKIIFAIPLYRTGITIALDKRSKEFQIEFVKNLKQGLKSRGINNNVNLGYPNQRAKHFEKMFVKKGYKIMNWIIKPLEKNYLALLLDYYKIPWRSNKILKAPFKVRYKIISDALKKTFRKYPKFVVRRYYLVAVVKKKSEVKL